MKASIFSVKNLLVCSILSVSALSNANQLDDLLVKVKSDGAAERAEHQQREKTFLNYKNDQQQQLDQTKTALTHAQDLHEKLQIQLSDNKINLAELNKELKGKAGNLNEVFGVVRQVSGDFNAQLHSSIISAQFPQRSQLLTEMAGSKQLPQIAQLKQLWYLLQQEMTESGKIVQFEASINAADGTETTTDVTRIGAFTVMNGADFLDYAPTSKRLVTLARQPDATSVINAKNFTASAGSSVGNSGLQTATIDPTRGAILSLFVEKPTLVERVKQGGPVGYAILALGVIGFLLAIWRVLHLSVIHGSVKRQQKNLDNINLKNPLGRILSVYHDNLKEDHQALEIKLEEAILNEAPKLDKGISSLKLLAAVAPLMGLLGTVVGMIATFQAITLFGTGDPKLMAGGISQALVTTVLGLVVAIPLLFCHSLVQARSKKLILVLSQQSAGLMAQKIEANAAIKVK